MSIEFQAWPKTPRLFRDIIVTEKIDGTNGAVIIQEVDSETGVDGGFWDIESGGKNYIVGAQSRNRLIYPGKQSDNYGFAAWVQENAWQLFVLLGPGRHFGEWWGKGIARGYNMGRRAFSLFNTERYKNDDGDPFQELVGDAWLESVPVLYEGPFDQEEIELCLEGLRKYGSYASPDFMNPEGICIYHTQSKQVYKITLDKNDKGKWE